MITDEQRKAFEGWAKWMDLNVDRDGDYLSVQTQLCHAAWQAALQVKLLEFAEDDYGNLMANTQFLSYIILRQKGSYVYNGIQYPVKGYAMNSANQDYQRRVLQCLVHGGAAE